MKHPVRKIRGKALWFGPEVEGMLRRVHTAFIRKALGKKDTYRVISRDGLQQIFLTEEFRDWAWLKKSGLWSRFAGKIVFTKACMPEEVAQLKKKLVGVRLFVRIDAPWALKLTGVDQVSLGKPYDLISFRVDATKRTHPADYEMDLP